MGDLWPLNTLCTTAELEIAKQATYLFNEFSGTPMTRAIKAVNHAHREWMAKHLSNHE